MTRFGKKNFLYIGLQKIVTNTSNVHHVYNQLENKYES